MNNKGIPPGEVNAITWVMHPNGKEPIPFPCCVCSANSFYSDLTNWYCPEHWIELKTKGEQRESK
jgi:hypothetical protein